MRAAVLAFAAAMAAVLFLVRVQYEHSVAEECRAAGGTWVKSDDGLYRCTTNSKEQT